MRMVTSIVTSTGMLMLTNMDMIMATPVTRIRMASLTKVMTTLLTAMHHIRDMVWRPRVSPVMSR